MSRFALMILMAPAGGKSTLTEQFPHHCADIERDVFFRRLHRIGRLCDDTGPNWESALDLHLGFMSIAAFSCLAHTHIGNAAPVNLVTAHNAGIVGLFAKGIYESAVLETSLSECEALNTIVERAINSTQVISSDTPGKSLAVGCVVGVVDRLTLDSRMHERQRYEPALWGFQHMGYAWTQSCHLLLDGIATRFGIPRLESASIESVLQDAQSRFPRAPLFSPSPDPWLSSGFRTFVFECNTCALDDATLSQEPTDGKLVRYAFVCFLPSTWALYAVVLAKNGQQFSDGEVALEALYDEIFDMDASANGITESNFEIVLTRRALSRPVHLPDGVGNRVEIRSDRTVTLSFGAPTDDMKVERGSPVYTYPLKMTTDQWTRNSLSWIPTHQVERYGADLEGPLLLLYYGSFAPFHAGHLETLSLAKSHLEARGRKVLGAIVAPIPFTYPKESSMDCMSSYQTRATIAALVCRHLPWIGFDRPPELSPEEYVSGVARRARQHVGAHVRVVWINGTDIPVTTAMERLVASDLVELVFVQRSGEVTENEHRPKLWRGLSRPVTAAESQRIHYCAELPRLALSSTSIRKRVIAADFVAAEREIGNAAAAALLFSAQYVSFERANR